MDVVSRILLQARGGDQVAQEIGKVKKAYEDTSKASQGIVSGGGVASSDPFTRATGGGTGSGTQGLAGQGDSIREKMRSREAEHYNRHGVNNGVKSLEKFTTSGISAVGQAGSGNLMGGGASFLTSLGSFGKAGIAGIIAGATLGAANSMSNADIDLRSQLFTGLGQRLGTNKKQDSFISSVLGYEKLGFKYSTIPLLQSMAEGGANQYNETDINSILKLSYNTGIDPSSIGKMYGRLQSAGAGGKSVFLGGDMAKAAEAGFGRSRMSEFYSTITTAIEGAMTQGFQKGSVVFTDVYNKYAQSLADLGRFGGVAPEAAVEMFRKSQDVISQSGFGIKSPEQAMQFMQMRKSDETYTDTLKRMAMPDTEIERFKNLESMSGGNEESLKLMVMSEYGMNIMQAEAYIKSKKTRISINASGANIRAKATGEDWLSISPEDEFLKRSGAAAQRDRALQGANDFVGGAVADVTQAIMGKPLTPEQKALQTLLSNRKNDKGGYGKQLLSYSDFLIEGNSNYLNMLPKGVGSFASGMYSNMMDLKYSNVANNPIVQNVIPEMGLYGLSMTNPKALTPEESKYIEKYKGAFEKTTSYLSGSVGQQILEPQNFDRLAEILSSVNEASEDGNKDIYSIVEILKAIEQFIKTTTVTPTGGTK